MSKTNNPMFEKTSLTILVQSSGGLRELDVYEMGKELFVKNGQYFLRIKQGGSTTNPKIDWLKFSNGKVPTFNTIGWAMADEKWRKAPKSVRLPKQKNSVRDSINARPKSK